MVGPLLIQIPDGRFGMSEIEVQNLSGIAF